MTNVTEQTAARGQQAGRAANTLASFKVIPSGRPLAAEIQGVDFSQTVPEDVKDALRKAWAEHLVLLIRGQQIDDEQLLATSGIFGPPHAAASRKYHLDVGEKVDDKLISRHPSVAIISNLDATGKPVLDNGGLGSYEVVWHTDNSYVEVPPAGSMLYSLEVPPPATGGDTSFNNQYLAYEELPDELKKAIEGKSQVHDSTRNSAGVLRPGVKLPATPEEVPGPTHPLVRVHPVTGKRALYLGRRRDWPSNYIIGMENAQSEALLDKLWAHATQPTYAWTHQWRAGDIVLWDNRCCMHYRTEVSLAHRRVMHRTTIKGEPLVAPW